MDTMLADQEYTGCMKGLMEASRASLGDAYHKARGCHSEGNDCDEEVFGQIRKHFELSQLNASTKQCEDPKYATILAIAQNLLGLQESSQTESVRRLRTSDEMIQKLGQ